MFFRNADDLFNQFAQFEFILNDFPFDQMSIHRGWLNLDEIIELHHFR